MNCSVCFIVPYFGKLPNTFPYWIKSCENNPEFNWVLLCDDTIPFSMPANVTIKRTTLRELKERIERQVKYEVALTRPYKLCDFRPLYGEIFSEELKGYSHWGYCDLDMIMGNLSHFFTDEILSSFDKISYLGHLSIYKNNGVINSCYKDCDYKSIIGDEKNRIFDEIRFEPNINTLLKNRGFTIYNDFPRADIEAEHFRFILHTYKKGNRCVRLPYYPNIFEYTNGNLYCVQLRNDKIEKEEVSYVHFQKRNIFIDNAFYNNYLLVPNVIISHIPVTEQIIIEYSKDNYVYTLKGKYRRLLRAIKSRVRR